MLLALLIAAAAPQPGPGAAAAIPPFAESPVSAQALALSRLLNPDREMTAIAMRAFEIGWDREFANPENARFETEHPGFNNALKTSARALFADHLRISLPAKRERFARFFTNRFAPGEIDALIKFYSSPIGAKVVAGIYGRMDVDKAVDVFASADGGKISGQDVAALTASASRVLATSYTADEETALATFSRSPAFAKLQVAMPAFHQLMADISNEPTPVFDAKIEAMAKVEVEAFLTAEAANKAE
jgi:hypothetical protein